jgi:hypothetical protein
MNEPTSKIGKLGLLAGQKFLTQYGIGMIPEESGQNPTIRTLLFGLKISKNSTRKSLRAE